MENEKTQDMSSGTGGVADGGEESPNTAGQIMGMIGGLSNSKLKLATATESDVASGKTFYAGNSNIKVGTNKNAGFSRIIRLYGYSIYDGSNNYFVISIFENGEFTEKFINPGESYEDESFSVRLTDITSYDCDGYFTPKVNITAKYVCENSFEWMTPTNKKFTKNKEYHLWSLHRVSTFCIIEFAV